MGTLDDSPLPLLPHPRAGPRSRLIPDMTTRSGIMGNGLDGRVLQTEDVQAGVFLVAKPPFNQLQLLLEM